MAQYEQKSKHKILWYFIMHILYWEKKNPVKKG